MKIFYQGNIGSYMWVASKKIAENLENPISEFVGLPTFDDVWKNISSDNLGVLAIENSYMGSIHHNLYNFLDYNYTIIAEYYLEINHCLCSLEKDIFAVREVYSQSPALLQCKNYLMNKNIAQKEFFDTAGSAQYIKENNMRNVGVICSEEAAEYYGLNILDKNIADQKGNTTRFVLLATEKIPISYSKKSHKVSIIFEAKDIPSSLYKCLGAFATCGINLTKIESLPSFENSFYYHFWIDGEGNEKDAIFQKALEELQFFTKNIRILGSY